MKQSFANFPVTLTGAWCSPSDDSCMLLSDTLKSWLLDEGSLTARLKSQCETFRLEVVGEQQQLCASAEACELIAEGTPVLVREVILYCDDIPQVFARSLLPISSLTGEEGSLAKLGNQPLGQVLFNNPSLQRQAFALSTFNSDSSVAKLAQTLSCRTDHNALLWGRRSILTLNNKPLMVAEVFLPQAFAYQ